MITNSMRAQHEGMHAQPGKNKEGKEKLAWGVQVGDQWTTQMHFPTKQSLDA